MDAGKLRHRVAIQAPATARDEHGGVVTTWAPVATVWAAVVALSGREFLAAQAVQAGVTTRITIRHRDGIVPAMRIQLLGPAAAVVATYNIKAVLPDPTLRQHLTLMCEQGVNDG